jgi:hypothetical protein
MTAPDTARPTHSLVTPARNSVPIEDLDQLLDVLEPLGSADIAIGPINLPGDVAAEDRRLRPR